MPTIIPAMAPSLFIRLSNMPRMMAGKKEAAAKPNANATTAATKPWRIDAKISCNYYCKYSTESSPHEFSFVRNIRFDLLFD